MRTRLRVLVIGAVAALLVAPIGSAHALNADTLVTVGSPSSPFSANKQNEPAVAIDANHPTVLAAGSNDNIDMEACNAGPDNDCPFTEGVGGSGVYFSFNSGDSWSQPTYTGWSARNCVGAPGDSDPPCEPRVGPIGTLPGYFEAGLVSDGDPAVAFGPVFRNGQFSWANGSRLYYANLTSNFPGQEGFKGFEAIAVSRIDGPASTGVTQAIVSDQANWKAPVIVSKQNSALFSDKEQVWADNAESSPFFGNTYICSAAFRGVPGTSQPLVVATSADGGDSWTAPRTIETAGDRGYYAAPAISPNGTDVWVVYNAFTTPFRDNTTSPRNLVGVVKHADVAAGAVGPFSETHRSPGGDPRGSSQNNLAAEFLGDYVYAAATRTYGAAVWNDVRRASDCPAIDTYRQALHDEAVEAGGPVAEPEEPRGAEDAVHHEITQEPAAVAPPVQQVCAGTFGNSDIFGGTYADPTP